jgi:hypothetical protein
MNLLDDRVLLTNFAETQLLYAAPDTNVDAAPSSFPPAPAPAPAPSHYKTYLNFFSDQS